MSITKQVVFVAKNGKSAELKNLLETMVDSSRREEGCLLYNIYYMEDKPETFVVIETWRDDSALKGHQSSAHYIHYKAHYESFTADKYSNLLVALK